MPNGKGYTISADKSFVTSAGHADGYVVSARTAGATEPTASTLYYVAKDAPDMTVAGKWAGLGLRGNASAPMRLNNVPVAAADRVSDEGDGFKVMVEVTLPWFQLGSTAVSVGIARSAVAAVRDHLLGAKLEHMGQTLASLPNLRAELARMQIAADAQGAFVHQVAWRMENPRPDTMLAVLESKAAANEAALQVTDLAMHLRRDRVRRPAERQAPTSGTPVPGRSWPRPRTCCTTSSARRCSGCLCSEVLVGAPPLRRCGRTAPPKGGTADEGTEVASWIDPS